MKRSPSRVAACPSLAQHLISVTQMGDQCLFWHCKAKPRPRVHPQQYPIIHIFAPALKHDYYSRS